VGHREVSVGEGFENGVMFSEALLGQRAEETTHAGTLTSPSVSLISALGGGPTTSGVRMSESTAEGIPAWFAVRGVVSETVGQVPLKVFRKLPRGKQPDENHSLYYVLHDQFNPEMTAYEGKELLTRNVCDWGNGYAEIVRDNAGRVKALWPLAPNRMFVDRDEFNRRRYRYRSLAGQGFEWIWNPARPPIFHLRANSLDGLVGRSAIRILADCFGLTKAAEEFGARFFSNNAMPGMVATYKGKLTKEQKQNLREGFQRVNGGLSNAHRLAILENDITLTKMGVDPAAAQFMELRGLQIEEIARTLRVPLFMIQHMTKSTSWGTGIEQMLIAFNSITMMPWYTMWQQTTSRDLLTQKSFATHAALFVVEAMMRGDFKTRQDGLAVQFDKGVITRNEWRALEDRTAMEDEFADEAMVPINNVVPASLARETFKKQAAPAPAPNLNAPNDPPADNPDKDTE
jgi:HK97 family phage portal protein